MRKPLFSVGAAAALSLLLLLAGCPPEPINLETVERGPDTFVAAPNRLFDETTEFDIRWRVVHPRRDEFDPSTAVTDRELTLGGGRQGRCTTCHDCFFPQAFDLANYETLEWQPRITGDDWAMPIRRMMTKENAFLNEVIAARIYEFLRAETLGTYDEAADDRGEVVIEVDELPPLPPDQDAGANEDGAESGEAETDDAADEESGESAGEGDAAPENDGPPVGGQSA